MSEPPCPSTVGIVVNPLAGTDIRRLVASASPTTEMAKVGIIRRAIIGAAEAGTQRILLSDDRRSLARRALDRIERDLGSRAAESVDVDVLSGPPHDHRSNTVRVARELRDRGAGALVVLGGDGTHRDVVQGWRDAPIVAVSTGTNNVFPRPMEATLAGHAAGAVASGCVSLPDVSWRAKVIDVEVRRADGSVEHDLALVDVALVDTAFTGSRAVWHGGSLRSIVATIAEPASVGLSAIAAACEPCGRAEPAATWVTLAPSGATDVRVPIAPGRYADLTVSRARRLDLGEPVEFAGPGTLSFDGERDVVLAADDRAMLTVHDDGPCVIDVDAAIDEALAARRRTHSPDSSSRVIPPSEDD